MKHCCWVVRRLKTILIIFAHNLYLYASLSQSLFNSWMVCFICYEESDILVFRFKLTVLCRVILDFNLFFLAFLWFQARLMIIEILRFWLEKWYHLLVIFILQRHIKIVKFFFHKSIKLFSIYYLSFLFFYNCWINFNKIFRKIVNLIEDFGLYNYSQNIKSCNIVSLMIFILLNSKRKWIFDYRNKRHDYLLWNTWVDIVDGFLN